MRIWSWIIIVFCCAQNPQAAGILDHLELTQDGSNVEIRISMSGTDVRAALQRSHPIAGD